MCVQKEADQLLPCSLARCKYINIALLIFFSDFFVLGLPVSLISSIDVAYDRDLM